jgi:hypothetical protein
LTPWAFAAKRGRLFSIFSRIYIYFDFVLRNITK